LRSPGGGGRRPGLLGTRIDSPALGRRWCAGPGCRPGHRSRPARVRAPPRSQDGAGVGPV